MTLDFIEEDEMDNVPDIEADDLPGETPQEQIKGVSDYIGKVFGEVLPEINNRGGYIKLGCKRPGFFFIGLKRDLTDEKVDALDAGLRKWHKGKIASAKNELKSAIAAVPTPSKYISTMYSKNGTFGDWNSYVEFVNEAWAKLPKLKKKLDVFQENYEERIPLMDKVVVDAFPSIDPEYPHQIIMLLEGCEEGEFWTLNEYEESVRRNGNKRGRPKADAEKDTEEDKEEDTEEEVMEE